MDKTGAIRSGSRAPDPIQVSLIATPEVDVSALGGLHGVFTTFSRLVPATATFDARIVVPDSVWERAVNPDRVIRNVMGMPLPMERRISEIDHTDILIIPSLYLLQPDWPPDPYPDLTEWIIRMHQAGALLCSSCTGAMLLAETGLLDGYEATQHWAFEGLFREHFPKVRLNIHKVLITTGQANRIIMSGASAAWHDLAVYLISRYATPQAAQTIARFFLLTIHNDGQTPYVIFREEENHGDGMILIAQRWLREHSDHPYPIEQVQETANLHPRTFNRRFQKATGLSPIHYVQQLRVAEAKLKLESTHLPVDEISYQVGYEDPAFFRRLFKRLTGMTPGMYRRKFQLPEIGTTRGG